MNEIEPDAEARKHHFLISMSRFAGMAVLMVGLYLVYGKQDLIEPVFGYLPILLGFLAFFFAPPILARRWSSDRKNEGGDHDG